ncbi:hypothetical protein WDU94_011457 [Cyamophila willieti]
MSDQSQALVVQEPSTELVLGTKGGSTREEVETLEEAEEHKEIKKKSGNTESLTKIDSTAKEETKQAVEHSVTKDPSGRIIKKMSMEQSFSQEWSSESTTTSTTKGPIQVLQIKN